MLQYTQAEEPADAQLQYESTSSMNIANGARLDSGLRDAADGIK